MKHLQLILNIIATNSGLLALLSSLLLLKKTKKREYLARSGVIVSFMFIFIPFLINNYFYNIKQTNSYVYSESPSIGIIFLIITLALYTNIICKPKNEFKITLFFAIYTLISFIHFFISVLLNKYLFVTLLLHSTGLSIAIVYIGLNLFRGKYSALTETIKKNRQIVGLMALLFLPLFILIDIIRIIDIFEMLHISRTILVVPVFFTVWSLFFIHEDIISVIYKKHKRSYKDFYDTFKFTPRERETGELLIKGFTYEEISKKLFVSKETIKTHIKNIYTKTEVSSKIQLINKIDNFIA